jgi:hypothetical protein
VVNIPFISSDYWRRVADSPQTFVRNRMMEENPQLNDNQTAFIARPGLKKFLEVGTGPVRRVYSCPGTFNDDLFAVSGLFLWRTTVLGVSHSIGQLGAVLSDAVSMAACAPLGGTPAFLYIADGGILWFYTDNAQATGDLNATGAINNGDKVQIDTIWYQFTTGSVDTGTPAGTSANPWLVAKGLTTVVALTNLYNAINNSGVIGTDYSSALQQHPTCTAYASDTTDLFVQYNNFGTSGNGIVTTETGANLSWLNGGTLTGGGTEELRQVQVPDDNGCISVTFINGFIIVVPKQNSGIKGRFYWIRPGSNVIDPLDFATAERSPDGITQALTFGDMFWLMGQVTTEPWITTGDATFPMQRYQGILYERGCWPDTAVQVKDKLILVDEDGAVWSIKGGQDRISNPAIEERIRLALQRQQFALFV